MSLPYLIEAIVQPAKHSPYIKVAYLSGNPNVDYHMEMVLQNEYYKVASVKSRPAVDVEMSELLWDGQGNMSVIDNVPVVQEDTNDNVAPNSDPQPGN